MHGGHGDCLTTMPLASAFSPDGVSKAWPEKVFEMKIVTRDSQYNGISSLDRVRYDILELSHAVYSIYA